MAPTRTKPTDDSKSKSRDLAFEAFYRLRALRWYAAVVFVWSLIAARARFVEDRPTLGLVFVVGGVLLVATLVRYRRLADVTRATHLSLGFILVLILTATIATGGMIEANSSPFFAYIVVSVFVLGRQGVLWSALALGGALVISAVPAFGYDFPLFIAPEDAAFDRFMTWFGSAAITVVVLSYYDAVRVTSQEHARQSAEALRVSKELVLHEQKTSALGRLAGGIAHDFNNLLTAMLMHLRFLQARAESDPERLEDLEDLKEMIDRGAALTNQLLAVSKRQPANKIPLDLAEVVENTVTMLRRLVGEGIELDIDTPDDLPLVEADSGQLEQVVLNLVLNARDALDQGGHIEIAVTVPPGRTDDEPSRVMLAITDDGCGMDEETRENVLDPYFTTREGGTGLGLSIVNGIVQQHGGQLEMESSPGEGSRFVISLPITHKPKPAEPASSSKVTYELGQGEHILVVEDELPVRRAVVRLFKDSGYRVDEAESGEQAMSAFEGSSDYDLVFSDIVLGGLSGIDLYDALSESHPDLPVLLCSGHAAQASMLPTLESRSLPFLRKPYDPDELLFTVRKMLDQRVSEDVAQP